MAALRTLLTHAGILKILYGITPADAATLDSRPSSILQIHTPESLNKPGGYNHTGALFGKPPFGKPLRNSLYYADSDLCDPHVDTSVGYPLRDEDQDGKIRPWPSPFILMADRGGCTFATKVRNAQRIGAVAVIVADNTCLCSDTRCISGGKDCQNQMPLMACDSTSYDIDIPSVLMSKSDADAIKISLRANDAVEAELSWPIPEAYDRVEFEYWFTPSDPSTTDFEQRFVDAAVALGSRARFTPHIFIFDHGCANPRDKYCMYSATENSLQDTLRHLCVWKQYGEDDGIGAKWWEYIVGVKNCDAASYTDSAIPSSTRDTCIEDIYHKVGIDGNVIDRCMQKSGGATGRSNTLFDKEISSREQRWGSQVDVKQTTAIVNGVPLLGSLSLHNVFDAICSGYEDGDEPEVCQQCSSCKHDKHSCVILGECREHGNSEGCSSTFSSGKSSGSDVKAAGVRKEGNARMGGLVFVFGCFVGAVVMGVAAACFLRKTGLPRHTEMEGVGNVNTPAYKAVDPSMV